MKIGDKVGFKVDYVNGGDQVVGTVEDIYDNIGKKIVIVKDHEKNLHKVREEDVIVFSEEPVEGEHSEEKRDPGEDTITISRKDLEVISDSIIRSHNFGMAETVACYDFYLDLNKALFDGGNRG